jgi:hypothetical protein
MSVDEIAPTEGLSALLAKVVERQAARDAASAELKAIERELDELENKAAEELGMSGLDGCRVAGKSWRVEETLRLSLTKENREELIEAAEAEGLEDAVTLNNATVKAWLTERAKTRGCPLEDAVKGTRFEGLVGQYVEVRLRGRTVA